MKPLEFSWMDFESLNSLYNEVSVRARRIAQEKYNAWYAHLMKEAVAVYGHLTSDRGWGFDEKLQSITTHKAILLKIEPLKPCSHEPKRFVDWTDGGDHMVAQYTLDCRHCGAEIEPVSWRAK